MITGNEPYFPIAYSSSLLRTDYATPVHQQYSCTGINIKQKFLMDFVMTNSARFGYDTEHCLEEGLKSFNAYLKFINNGN